LGDRLGSSYSNFDASEDQTSRKGEDRSADSKNNRDDENSRIRGAKLPSTCLLPTSFSYPSALLPNDQRDDFLPLSSPRSNAFYDPTFASSSFDSPIDY
jgi:hypothetical protein